jgi:hypothetical protein
MGGCTCVHMCRLRDWHCIESLYLVAIHTTYHSSHFHVDLIDINSYNNVHRHYIQYACSLPYDDAGYDLSDHLCPLCTGGDALTSRAQTRGVKVRSSITRATSFQGSSFQGGTKPSATTCTEMSSSCQVLFLKPDRFARYSKT